MEDKQVTQAFQKALAGLSREDQALGILYFTAEMDAWEAMDAGKHVDGDIQQDWGDIGISETHEAPGSPKSRRQKAGRNSRVSKTLLVTLFVVAALAVIEAVWIVAMLLYGGSKAAEPGGPVHTLPEPDSGYARPAETGADNAGISGLEQNLTRLPVLPVSPKPADVLNPQVSSNPEAVQEPESDIESDPAVEGSQDLEDSLNLGAGPGMDGVTQD